MAAGGTSTMDFFAHQDAARRKTGLLILYYALAVVLIVVAIYLAYTAAFVGFKAKTGRPLQDLRQLWHPEVLLGVSVAVLGIVGLGTAYKIHELSGGGESVARMLGGRPVSPNTRDPDERKLLNVVEEMAIASGTPVPSVFLLDGEPGINAFAAGFAPSDAVIGVTRGCMEQLSRDELQGVIAHEFSHIFNGDMRLNIRLMGVLNGILIIGITGYWIFRSTLGSGSRSRSSKGKGNTMPIVLFGLVVMAVGYIGVLFGKLIKSAVSRQREFLADASSVQFTRNPGGLAGALKKIGGWTAGSRIQSRKAEHASHLFFSNGLASTFLNLMATHPPLGERIRRIDRGFDGQFASVPRAGAAEPGPGAAGVATGLAPSPPALPAQPRSYEVAPEEVMSRVGSPKPEHLAYAMQVVEALPNELLDAAREPFGARAVVYCLLLNAEQTARTAQLKRLSENADPAVLAETRKIQEQVTRLPEQLRLPLLDVAVPALKTLSDVQYGYFMENVDHLVRADEKIDLFEFALQRMIRRHLEPSFRKVNRGAAQYGSVKALLPESVQLLSALAYWGNSDLAAAQTAFSKGAKRLQATVLLRMSARENCTVGTVDAALSRLALGTPAVKKRVLDACVTCVGADGQVTSAEAELLRAVADSLDCPVPPFLPGQNV